MPTKIKCTARTCIYWQKGNICEAQTLEMVDLEYYETIEKKKQELTSDEMKCATYKKIHYVDAED